MRNRLLAESRAKNSWITSQEQADAAGLGTVGTLGQFLSIGLYIGIISCVVSCSAQRELFRMSLISPRLQFPDTFRALTQADAPHHPILGVQVY